ncbi:hypothetical protein FHL15_009944 [Xylaria flabelliformis]|uniref:Uncharacterized protein n=1 Tax=Xylaria flabelliformis TaxID=2512241 RepID=A0A553HMG3_9PEZI|nr:hypothetical protein FHL15_009944 [Xylaria flabelliformis]
MADADYFLDLSSSPDPLADDAPSSVRPASRRINKLQHDLPSLSIPQSSPRRGLREQSPRKRTFQLDVGDERSPQRIRVTVEADEALRRDNVNRRLFSTSASPTRSPRRRETITTTTVPLNDDLDGDVNTPRKRGRPRRISNGTPMPRSRKRAGTPIQRESKQARKEDNPPSEASILNDALINIGADGSQGTPKPRAKIRKTPRKPPAITPVPSSQGSNRTTGRKRGRPRKIPISEEPAVITGARSETSGATTSAAPALELNIQHDYNISSNAGRDGATSEHIDDRRVEPTFDSSPGRSIGVASPPRQSSTRDLVSSSPTSSNQELAENDGYMMSEDYQGMEPQSDLQSAESEDGEMYRRQDTIADASDFSMIAVESLPSFQASFQASLYSHADQSALDQQEMGEETSQIINETLESLRRSLQAGAESSSRTEAENDSSRVEERDEMQDQSTMTPNYGSGRLLSRSPRRFKPVPLSRQVFVGRGNIDDSFSTIPDSILHAATPGRSPVKPIVGEDEHQTKENGPYDDSFSEIPDAVLEAATPRPVRRVETPTHSPPARNEELHQITRSAASRPSLGHGSNRLPTPEDTSSSNADSRKAHEEDAGLELEEQAGSAHRTDAPSSPPIRTRPRALDFGYSNLQHELNAVQERRSSSPQRQSNQHPSLEAPLPPPRPSLSPIVRAGRTLQNVMSDNSSPEGRERNLGSPFKGSMGSDPRQSSVARSPSPSIRNRGVLNKSQLSVGSPTRLARNYRSNLDRNFGTGPPSSGEPRDAFGHGRNTHSRTGSLQDSTMQKPPNFTASVHNPSINDSTKAGSLDIGGNVNSPDHGNNSQPMSSPQPSSQTASSHNHKDATRHINVDQASRVDTDLFLEQDQDHHDEPVQDMDQDLGDRSGEEHADDIDTDDDIDIWDIEASRTSPGKRESPQTTVRPLKSDVPPSRRSKVPSPWRRNNRRLIYKDDIASSSQIEIEESSQSEAEQYPSLRSRERGVVPQPQPGNQERVPDPEPVMKSPMQEELRGRADAASPNLSHDDGFGEYAGPADSDEDEILDEDNVLNPLEQPHETPEPIPEDQMHENHEQNEVQEEPEDLDMPAVPEASIDDTEYSMVAQQAKQTPRIEERPGPSKPGFFGKFDILSFFSSPATLPRNKSPATNPLNHTNNTANPQPALEPRQLKEPPKAIWSTGLFPPLPQKNSQPSSRRRTDVFSPGPALRSTDTVADTYEPSTTVSPSSTRSISESVAPSTPERPVFPPIQQKQNFTPQPGGSRGSLFAPSQRSSSATIDEVQESSDEQESSALTEGSEYERVPPREKPSQWDRNLSPAKSCFRSPLKPTTPGRLVAFSNNALSPSEQAQTRNTLSHSATNARNIISQGPAFQPTLEGKENQPHTTQKIRSANNNSLDNENVPRFSTASSQVTGRQLRALAPAPPKPATATFVALSQTTWSRQHWYRLDEMLQLRRRDPLRFQQLCTLPPRDRRRSAALLGKEVAAQDARLILEPWHLDIVEAFKLEVGGWDERALAKRVFALIIGEEKRRDNTAVAAR